MEESRKEVWRHLLAMLKTLELVQLAMGNRKVTWTTRAPNRTYWLIPGHQRIQLIDIVTHKCKLCVSFYNL